MHCFALINQITNQTITSTYIYTKKMYGVIKHMQKEHDNVFGPCLSFICGSEVVNYNTIR